MTLVAGVYANVASVYANNNTNDSCYPLLHPFVYNLTASYADQRNEATMVFTSVVMFMLAALFFNLNLFSRFSDVSAILNPTVRLFLSSSLSLFLPVMSYLFSEAKNEGAAVAASYAGSRYSQLDGTELSLRARTILMWMLLVELLRKKVEANLVNVGMQSYSSTIDRASRIAWLGYLVFYNLSSTGKKAFYGILWVLAAGKLLQRVVINELLKRGFAYGRNAELLNFYMEKIIEKQDQQEAEAEEDQAVELLKKCDYAVMGEEKLEMKISPEEGYHLELKDDVVVTVGDIWMYKDRDQLLQEDLSLKMLCLSFALHKLLRRRFEEYPISDDETRSCRSLIFLGLRQELLQRAEEALAIQKVEEERREDLKATAVAVALFQVFDDEVQFLCEYYHSVLPVVLSNPFFLLTNYILFPILVFAFCILTFILCANGDVLYAYHSLINDNYIISTGTLRVFGCLLRVVVQDPASLFTTVDLAVTMLLLLTFVYEEIWELVVLILSNWLMVSLLCDYADKLSWRQSRVISGLIRYILWMRRRMSRPNLCFKQLSVLGFGRRSSMALPLPRRKAVPMEVTKSIIGFLVAHNAGDHPLSNGWSTLRSEKHIQCSSSIELAKACESKSVAEVILTWHIATSLLEVRYPLDRKKATMGAHRKVATTLSGYCAYLVAYHPDLLPDNAEGTKRVYNNMKDELKKVLGGCWSYHVSLQATRFDKLVNITEVQGETAMLVHKAVELGKKLMKMAEGEGRQEDQVWELLADIWTELIVYVAPSNGEPHVKAHKEALALGGEFITVIWALCTHTGITRPAVAPWEQARRSCDP
ncbi:hypothetical protein BS78_05G080400 [Paspalum vaginatum]|nr:hypothetical protein BS78_05G080400 [Paspalum vaginatum]